MREELLKSEYVQKRYNQIKRKGKSEADKWLGMLVRTVMHECSCMTCNHPACVFRGESDHHYCGNYVSESERRRTVEKIKVCACNDNHGNCDSGTNNNDSASDTRH